MAEHSRAPSSRGTRLDDALACDLRRAVEAEQLLRLLRGRARLTQQVIATATGASLRSVRNWELLGVQLRRRHDDRLRYLADVVAVLSGTLTPRGVSQWLNAQNRNLASARPVDLLADDERAVVLDAARALVGDSVA